LAFFFCLRDTESREEAREALETDENAITFSIDAAGAWLRFGGYPKDPSARDALCL
jgi:hypothetical protein